MNELLFLSKIDIPFIEGKLVIHQPTIKEIAYMGEKNFYTACNLLNFSKEKFLTTEDKIKAKDQHDFDILMSILLSKLKDNNSKKAIENFFILLSILFPNYEILLNTNQLEFKKEEQIGFINKTNFDKFKQIIANMFCLNKKGEEEIVYNPARGSSMAQQIAKKLEERKAKLAQIGNNNSKSDINILSKYLSILTVGEKKDMNLFLNYTIFQLHDEYERYGLKVEFDNYVKARLAGAKDLKEVKNWTIDIH